jgi:large subunit ribosomal protein L10
MARPDKAAAVAEMTDRFRASNAAVLTEYRGLTVAQLTSLRKSLSANATYAVVKNTLTSIAAKEAGVALLDADLTGPTAIAFVTGDPVEAAKGLRDFSKTNPALVIKGGVLDGRALSADEVKKLADLESREVLLAKLAGAMKASLNQAAYLFVAPLAKAARTIDALRLKLAEGQEAAPAAQEDAASTEAAVAAGSNAAQEDAASTEAAVAAESDTAEGDAASADAAPAQPEPAEG